MNIEIIFFNLLKETIINIKSAFIAIVGRPNVGKSTFVNNAIGQKISITSDIAQTTRNQIRGIYNDNDSQIVFIDSPGYHTSKDIFGENLNKKSFKTIIENDLVLFFSSINDFIGKNDLKIIQFLKNNKKKVILILTKKDLAKQDQILSKIKSWSEIYGFDHIIPINNFNASDIDYTIQILKTYCNDDNIYYLRDQYTDQSEKFYIQEIIREQILKNTYNEIPHHIAIIVDDIKKYDDYNDVFVSIIVDRQSQKPIILGKKGATIKKIRLFSQKNLRLKFNKPINIELFVKIENNWRKSNKIIAKIENAS